MLKETTFGPAGGTLGPYVVSQLQSHDSVEELVAFQFDGTWSGATVTLYLCNNPDASPQVWTAMTSGAFTADVADIMRLPSGVAFKAVSGGSTASPQAGSIYAAVRGQFVS